MNTKCMLREHSAPTIFHILNGCPVALDQDRYSWRHDSVLMKIVKGLKQLLPPVYNLYSDLDGCRASDNPPATIPPELLVTTARPDIGIINGSDVLLLELTVPHNSKQSIIEAHRRKEGKVNYCCLLEDLENIGLNSTLISLEIGSLGHWLSSSCRILTKHLTSITKSNLRALLDEAGKIAIAASYQIFLARHEKHWPKHRTLLV